MVKDFTHGLVCFFINFFIIIKDGSKFQGNWNNNKLDGKGSCELTDGRKYDGE